MATFEWGALLEIPHQIAGVGSGTVVGHDQLEATVGLRCIASQHRPQGVRPVVGGDDDGDVHALRLEASHAFR